MQWKTYKTQSNELSTGSKLRERIEALNFPSWVVFSLKLWLIEATRERAKQLRKEESRKAKEKQKWKGKQNSKSSQTKPVLKIKAQSCFEDAGNRKKCVWHG